MDSRYNKCGVRYENGIAEMRNKRVKGDFFLIEGKKKRQKTESISGESMIL